MNQALSEIRMDRSSIVGCLISLLMLFGPLAGGAEPGGIARSEQNDVTMIAIRGGSYQMGDLPGKDHPVEKPVHLVTVKSFRLGAYDVTFDQYDRFSIATGRQRPDDQGWGRGSRPVINVTWVDAMAFIEWLNHQGNAKYRLPTEAEWEFAARAGATSDYYWGATASHEQANYGTGQCCDGIAHGRDVWVYTSPAGSFPPNAWGLYDMSGNVWQWTQDCWNESYVSAPSDGSAWLSGNCDGRVVRGGSWGDDPVYLRLSSRHADGETYSGSNIGFRLAQDE